MQYTCKQATPQSADYASSKGDALHRDKLLHVKQRYVDVMWRVQLTPLGYPLLCCLGP